MERGEHGSPDRERDSARRLKRIERSSKAAMRRSRSAGELVAIGSVIALATLVAAAAVVEQDAVKLCLAVVAFILAATLIWSRETLLDGGRPLYAGVVAIVGIAAFLVGGQAVRAIVVTPPGHRGQSLISRICKTDIADLIDANLKFIAPYSGNKIGTAPLYRGTEWQKMVSAAAALERDSDRYGKGSFPQLSSQVADYYAELDGTESQPNARKPYSNAFLNIMKMSEACDKLHESAPSRKVSGSTPMSDDEYCDMDTKFSLAIATATDDWKLTSSETDGLGVGAGTLQSYRYTPKRLRGRPDLYNATWEYGTFVFSWMQGKKSSIPYAQSVASELTKLCSHTRFRMPALAWDRYPSIPFVA